MSNPLLKSLNITNFRSIRGQIHTPLDAPVVLIHGENGAGKTSLLSAIELGLTGSVQALQRADSGYASQLLHRSTSAGNLVIETENETEKQQFVTEIGPKGIISGEHLSPEMASFFSERSYLPQSHLGQLLQIYQESDSSIDSPLARFVGDLLGLDRLDALEEGLKPLSDVRNIRKIANGWSHAEIEKDRLEKFLEDQRGSRLALRKELTKSLEELKAVCVALGLANTVNEEDLDNIEVELDRNEDERKYAKFTDKRRLLDSMRRDLERELVDKNRANYITTLEETSAAIKAWETAHGDRVSNIRSRVETLLPQVSLPSDLIAFSEEAIVRLRSEHKQLVDRANQARADMKRHAKAADALVVAGKQLGMIDQEMAQMSGSAGSLGAAIAEISSFIVDDLCPVCERDYQELKTGSLGEHVNAKVRTLSASAERLLTLGHSRSEQQILVERLESEIKALEATVIGMENLAKIDRKSAVFTDLIQELAKVDELLRQGSALRAADVAARRAFSRLQSQDSAITAARETFAEFALMVDQPGLAEDEFLEAAFKRVAEAFAIEDARLTKHLTWRREGKNIVSMARSSVLRRDEIDRMITAYSAKLQQVNRALNRGQAIRKNGQAIRSAVDKVRSAVIGRAFNDRLNHVWRDLFVRLAPDEPFVPAFRIPPSGTLRLQPKLITMHREDGKIGGTPGAMLSAGNLNTAALTLFMALHLSVPAPLPWLILDDPVQSMDDIHIAHFAALLRTLSKEHGRQILIAVHDRQLFEYLKLELSPAYSEDNLLTLELLRSANRDTLCVSDRLTFREETTLFSVA